MTTIDYCKFCSYNGHCKMMTEMCNEFERLRIVASEQLGNDIERVKNYLMTINLGDYVEGFSKDGNIQLIKELTEAMVD